MKPLQCRNYGSIPHLPNSRLGPGDHHCHAGQAVIMTEKTRDRHDVVHVFEKLDGCLSYNEKILTEDGPQPIGTIVNGRKQVRVASYNEATGLCELKPIVEWHRNPVGNKKWVRVHSRSKSRGAHQRTVTCTSNHKFFTQRGWVEAGSLLQTDRSFLFADKMSGETRQVILGKMLGDGSVSRPTPAHSPTLAWCQGEAQSEYFDLTLRLLGPTAKETTMQRGGYEGSGLTRRGRVGSSIAMTDLIGQCLGPDGQPYVTQYWADSINPLGLAIWFMDDGSASASEKEQRRRAMFHVNAYSAEEAERLSRMLRDRFGIENKIFDRNGPTISLTADATERLFEIIYPYVPKSMSYKLSPEYQGRPCVLDGQEAFRSYTGIIETEIISVEEAPPMWVSQDWSFDLTVEDNHNYFANDTLVHNSNVGIARVGSEIFALQRSGYVASTSPYEMHVLFADWVEVNKSFWRDVLADGERLVGEWLAQAHGTKYSLPKGPFVAFDLIEGDARAPIMDVIGMCSSFGIPTPRHVHSGAAIAVDEALAICGHGDHGCLDEPEGLVYRVERKGRFDFAAKYVKPGKIDGLYLPGVTGSISEVAVWNWHPKMRAEQTA